MEQPRLRKKKKKKKKSEQRTNKSQTEIKLYYTQSHKQALEDEVLKSKNKNKKESVFPSMLLPGSRSTCIAISISILYGYCNINTLYSS